MRLLRRVIALGLCLGRLMIFLPATAGALDARLIVPGRRIGRVRLGEEESAVIRALGKPDHGDAAMMHHLAVWEEKGKTRAGGRSDTLTLFSSLDPNNGTGGDRITVKFIRVTSPWFRTAAGLSTGRSLAAIRRTDKHLRLVATYRVASNHRRVAIYDDVRRGIAFEFPSGPATGARCLAISVHPPGMQAAPQYMPLGAWRNLKAVTSD